MKENEFLLTNTERRLTRFINEYLCRRIKKSVVECFDCDSKKCANKNRSIKLIFGVFDLSRPKLIRKNQRMPT